MKEQNIDNFINNIKSTKEYFNMTIDELLENRNEYTREECKIFDEGVKVTFLDNLMELQFEKDNLETYIKNYEYEIKTIVKTVNERLAVVLI